MMCVFRRLVTAVNDIEKRVPFSHNDRLGFLTFCPTNLGTTVRASVHIKVPKLAANKAKLEEVAARYNLQVSILYQQLENQIFFFHW
jgi:creatine kinase